MHRSLLDFMSSIDVLIAHLEFEQSSQTYFQEGVKKHTGNSDVEVEFRAFVKNRIRPSFVSSKTFTYKNAIISLYGHLERFIEDIIEEYLQNIREVCKTYSSLPLPIRKNHFDASLAFMAKIQRIKGLTPEQQKFKINGAVESIHSCLQESNDYSVNYEAFLAHSSNFRYDSIHEIFSRIGIDAISRKCLDMDYFAKAVAERYNIDEVLDKKILISLLISELDDLAQRRNEIAHGVRIDQIESIQILKDRVSLIRIYGQAINEVVSEAYNLLLFNVSEKHHIGTPSRAFNKLRVLGFEQDKFKYSSEIFTIRVGNMIAAQDDGGRRKIITGKIKSIKIGHEDKQVIELPCDESFSIGVDFDFNNHILDRNLYVIKGA